MQSRGVEVIAPDRLPRPESWDQEAAHDLLSGESMRGLLDDDLSSIQVQTAVMAALDDNVVHRHRTAHRVINLIEGASALPAFPETPRPEFSGFLDAYVDAIAPADA